MWHLGEVTNGWQEGRSEEEKSQLPLLLVNISTAEFQSRILKSDSPIEGGIESTSHLELKSDIENHPDTSTEGSLPIQVMDIQRHKLYAGVGSPENT